MQLAVRKTKSTYEAGDIVAITDDSHVFSPREYENYNIVTGVSVDETKALTANLEIKTPLAIRKIFKTLKQTKQTSRRRYTYINNKLEHKDAY